MAEEGKRSGIEGNQITAPSAQGDVMNQFTPTIALVDGHYPAFKDITGLAFNISIVMSATDITFEQSMLREEQAERLVLAWNQHDQLVAENAALHEKLARKDEACNNTINAALMMPDPVRAQLVEALQSMEMALAGYLHQNDITRRALSKCRAAITAAGVTP